MAQPHAPEREQKNWLTPRKAPYQFSNEKRTSHYQAPEEMKSRKWAWQLLLRRFS
jgi:hypothetical protein